MRYHIRNRHPRQTLSALWPAAGACDISALARSARTIGTSRMLALPNQRWSLDFVHDQFATGRRVRISTSSMI